MSEQKSSKSTEKSIENTAPAKKRGRPKGSKNKSKGLGDDIEKITKATGIKAAVDWFSEATGVDCGCDARKEKLNKLFPRKSQISCLEAGEYETLKQFFSAFDGRAIKEEYQEPLARIHARVFSHKFAVPCPCAPKEWKQYINDLKGLYQSYEGDRPV